MQLKGKHAGLQNTSSVQQLSKIADMVHVLYCLSWGGHCIYGTYIVPPIVEGLKHATEISINRILLTTTTALQTLT